MQSHLLYKREVSIPLAGVENTSTNIADFVISDKIIIDLKAKPFVSKDDYYQMNRYLIASSLNLGMIVNFRNKFLRPIRVIRSNS